MELVDMMKMSSCDLFHETYMSHFSYLHKMRCPLNLVLENWEYIRFYWTFWIVNLDGDLNSISFWFIPLSFFRKDEKYIKSLFEVPIVLHFLPYLLRKNLRKKISALSLKINYWSPRHQIAASKAWISFKCSYLLTTNKNTQQVHSVW